MPSRPEPGGAKKTRRSSFSSEALKQIDEAFRSRSNPDSEACRFFKESQQKWEEIVRPQIQAIQTSELLTEGDFAIRINTRDSEID